MRFFIIAILLFSIQTWADLKPECIENPALCTKSINAEDPSLAKTPTTETEAANGGVSSEGSPCHNCYMPKSNRLDATAGDANKGKSGADKGSN